MKTYIRVGRCFKEVPDYIGMFYDGKIFTTERTDRSYAVCYDQRGTICYLAKIEFELGTFTFDDAIALTRARNVKMPNPCIPYHRLPYLPTREQAMMAFSRCPILRTTHYSFAWTQEEYSGGYAWNLDWYDGDVGPYHKSKLSYVRLFFEINL